MVIGHSSGLPLGVFPADFRQTARRTATEPSGIERRESSGHTLPFACRNARVDIAHRRHPLPTSQARTRSRMKAIVIHEFGPPDVLKYEDVPDPQPRAGEIRIRVHAATVNRVLDVSLRAGKEMFRAPGAAAHSGRRLRRHRRRARARRHALEGRTARGRGRRHAARRLCRRTAPTMTGREGMMGIKRPGGFAELVCVPACAVVAVPDGLDFHDAAVVMRHCPDRLESPGQRRQAPARRERADHGRRRQSRHDRHPDRQERDRRQGDRGSRLATTASSSGLASAPTTASTTTRRISTPR